MITVYRSNYNSRDIIEGTISDFDPIVPPGSYPAKMEIAKVYDWFDCEIHLDGEVIISEDRTSTIRFQTELEEGLYMVSCVKSDEAGYAEGKSGKERTLLGAFTVEKKHHDPLRVYREVVARRDSTFLGKKYTSETNGSCTYHVFVFVKRLKIGTWAQYKDVEVIPFDYLGRESECDCINRFISEYEQGKVFVNSDQHRNDFSGAVTVFVMRNIMAASYDEAEEYALRNVNALNSVYTMLLRSNGSPFATVVMNDTERYSRISFLDVRYTGNLLLIAEQGFNILHYYKHIADRGKQSRFYLQLLQDAVCEDKATFSYYRYWMLLEEMAANSGCVGVEKKNWNGNSVVVSGKKKRTWADDAVYEMLRRRYAKRMPEESIVGELERLNGLRGFLAICYQRRSCCVHHGGCQYNGETGCTEFKRDMERQEIVELCRSMYVRLDRRKAAEIEDKVLNKLQGLVFRVVLDYIHEEAGDVPKEDAYVEALIAG